MNEHPALQFHVIAFEGPDAYARAGGLSSRVSGLTEALAEASFETHLWFIGDPGLPGHETKGALRLHRWCQWISAHHPGGVYDGEEGKRLDLAASLPPFLVHETLLPHLRAGAGQAVILAEEWQTPDTLFHLDWLLRTCGVRDRVSILWNANNIFGFERIDWRRLAGVAVVTTVSRYMRHRMWSLGVDPVVIPNGLPVRAFSLPEPQALTELHQRLGERLLLSKVARWDPDKRWLLAIDAVGELKRQGLHPLLVARGGVEEHGAEVLGRAAAAGLRVVERRMPAPGASGVLASLGGLEDVDVLNVRSRLDSEAQRLLFRGSTAMLANSGHEPFGLVGLEAMAVGGVAWVGGTGEDYAVPGWNTLVVQSADPGECARIARRLHTNPAEGQSLRRHGRTTARRYGWQEVVRRNLLPSIPVLSGHLPLTPPVGA